MQRLPGFGWARWARFRHFGQAPIRWVQAPSLLDMQECAGTPGLWLQSQMVVQGTYTAWRLRRGSKNSSSMATHWNGAGGPKNGLSRPMASPRWGCRVWEKNTMQLAVQNENGRLWAMR
jgi:hypothetical protein